MKYIYLLLIAGLKHILLLSVFALSSLNLPRTLSHPINTEDMEEWWINTLGPTSDRETSSSSKCNMLRQIVEQANIAKFIMKKFQNDTSRLGHINIQLQDFFVQHSILAEETTVPKYENMDLNEFLVNAYHCLQRFAVGVHKLNKDSGHVNILQAHLKSLIFEISYYLYDFDITPKPDVHTSDFADYDKPMDNSARAIFTDALVKEIVKSVEYIHEALVYYNGTECN